LPSLTVTTRSVVSIGALSLALSCGSHSDESQVNPNASLAGASGMQGAGGAQSGAGGNGTSGSSGSGVGTGSSTGTGALTGTGAGPSGNAGGPTTAACSGLPFQATDAGVDGGTCAGISLEAERVDVDMYIMMDRSVSMAEQVGTTGRIRWDFVRDAVRAFVQDPGAANIGVGIQFFGQSGSRDDALDCDVTRYSTPAVPIGLASTAGADVVAAVDGTLPGGLTPTFPALQGAVAYGQQWATGHPGRATVVVLVTDGFPTQCQNPVSVGDIADVAQQAAAASPPVRTYVVGLAAGYNLDTIARAGGTRQAFLIDEGDITQSFVTTLLNISTNPLSCEYEIPTPSDPTQQLDFDKVQVVYTPAVGGAEEIPRAQNSGECSGSAAGGWYYDTPTNPSKILVCPCTCSRFAAGKVEVRLGCEPRPVSIH
jgi:hypothetical protein